MTKFFTNEIFAGYPKSQNLPDSPMTIEGYTGSLFFTSFRGSSDLNYQMNYAFNGDVYYYVFGERVNMCQLDGLAIPAKTVCADTSVASTPTDFVKFYKSRKLGASSSPTRIVVGGLTWSGYFVSLNVSLVAGRENTYIFSLGLLARVDTN